MKPREWLLVAAMALPVLLLWGSALLALVMV